MSVGEESAKPEEMVVVLMLVVAVAVVGVIGGGGGMGGGSGWSKPHKILYLRIVQPTVDILEPLWPWRMVWWRW